MRYSFVELSKTNAHLMEYYLYKAASFCFRPAEWGITEILRQSSVSVMIPGKYGNASTPALEIANRVFKAVGAAFITLLSLPLVGIGTGLEILGERLFATCYQKLEGSVMENALSPTMKLLSANVCMLPWGIWWFAGVSRHAEQRIDELAEKILTLQADIVCLQELAPPYAELLWEKIKESYPHGATHIGPIPISRMGSNLFVASKFPLQDAHFYPFEDDLLVGRGIFTFHTKQSWILATHLQAGNDEKHELTRKKQLNYLKSVSFQLQKKKDLPVFVLMDSNCKRTGIEQDEYSQVGINEDFINPLSCTKLSEETSTCTNKLSYIVQGKDLPENIAIQEEHIDCILLQKSNSKSISSFQVEILPNFCNREDPDKTLSDHVALIGTISINGHK